MLDPGGNEWHFPCCAVVRRRRLPLPKTDLKGKRDSLACNDFVASCGRCDINLAWLEGRDVTRTPIILEFYANLLARANERLGEVHLVQVVWVLSLIDSSCRGAFRVAWKIPMTSPVAQSGAEAPNLMCGFCMPQSSLLSCGPTAQEANLLPDHAPGHFSHGLISVIAES